MKIEIIKSNNNELSFRWNDKGETGQIDIEYIEKGVYSIDAEYISIRRLIEIMRNIDPTEISLEGTKEPDEPEY